MVKNMTNNEIFFEPGQHKEAGFTYNPFKALVAPRPIGWISSQSADGIANLGAYSYFNALSDLPAMIMFSSAPDAREGRDGHKDTLSNIEQTGEFAVNICNAPLLSAMVKSSAAVAPEVDEFALSGLTKKQGRFISAPYIAEAPAALECTLFKTIPLPGNGDKPGCTMVIGRVVGIHIDGAFVDEGLVDGEKLQQVARLGYKYYSTVHDIFEA